MTVYVIMTVTMPRTVTVTMGATVTVQDKTKKPVQPTDHWVWNNDEPDDTYKNVPWNKGQTLSPCMYV